MNFSKGRQFGLLAQEMEKVFPDLVSDDVNTWNETITQGEKEKIKYGQ